MLTTAQRRVDLKDTIQAKKALDISNSRLVSSNKSQSHQRKHLAEVKSAHEVKFKDLEDQLHCVKSDSNAAQEELNAEILLLERQLATELSYNETFRSRTAETSTKLNEMEDALKDVLVLDTQRKTQVRDLRDENSALRNQNFEAAKMLLADPRTATQDHHITESRSLPAFLISALGKNVAKWVPKGNIQSSKRKRVDEEQSSDDNELLSEVVPPAAKAVKFTISGAPKVRLGRSL